jgi:amino acid adenylation domain-containing protein
MNVSFLEPGANTRFDHGVSRAGPVRDPVASTFALTPLQKGFLAESLVARDKGVNIEQIVWELDHVPDAARFRAAWQSALDAFDALRLSFVWPGSGGEPLQSVVASVRVPFQKVDWPAQSSTQPDHRLESFLAQDRRAGLDLSSVPLMRVSLLVWARCRAVCVWTVHHAVIDGNSYAAVLQRVLDDYARLHGLAQVPGDSRPPFTDFLRWLESYDSEPGKKHFADLLRDFGEPTPLPLQEDSGRTAENRSSLTSLSLDLEATAKLHAAAQTTASSPTTLVQLAWALLLSRYSGADDVLFGATWSGRARTIEQAARVVGPFINTLPVRVRLSDAGTVRDLLGVLRQQHLALRPFQHTALGDIRAASPLAPFAQLFQTNVVFDKERFYTALPQQDGRWRGHKIWSRSQTSIPLVLAAYFVDGALVMDLEYDVGLYTDQTARRLLADYRRLLTNISLSLDDSPYTVPMLDPSRCAQLTVEESRRERLPAGRSAVERIFERASSNPRATAVRELRLEISYAELEGRVRRLSGVLRARGVERGVVVGVLLPRSIDAVVSLLAVHVAGGAFVPLDPAAPRQSLEFIVRDSGAKAVLVCGETRGRLESAHEIELDIESPAVTRAQDPPGPLAFPESTSLAYVIYTSGSTGEPNGVCVSHGALANHLEATLDRFALGPHDRVLQFTPLTFDVFLEEMLPTLVAGATLVLRSDGMANSARGFFDGVLAEGITVLNLPTAFWHQLVRAEHVKWPSCLRLVVVGGEQVSPEAHRLFRAADTGHIRWLNAYGPTEAAITSTCYDDAEHDHTDEFIPIGRPLPGVSHFVLDPYMRLAPVGQSGQLYIGGAGLASGYLNREELTRLRFVEHPFRKGARLYATGDRVRRTDAGNYVYVDRLDNQVKIRGFRVELGEVEARLRQHPAISDAAVVLQKRGVEQGSLVGFVVADKGAATAAELRNHLAAALSSYMIPSHLVITPRLPTMPSGKIDRRALAERDPTGPGEPEPRATPGDPLLRTLFRIWSRILDTPVTDAAASFFDLGGDSLQVVEMFLEIERCLGITCEAPAFFRNPTIGTLLEVLRPNTRMGWSAPLLELSPGHARVRPLFLAPAISGRGIDYVYLAEALGAAGIPVYALQNRDSPHPDFGQETLRQAAVYFASLMMEVQPRGPYAVAGFSAGGVAAMAIAEELRALGESTDFVGLIDSVPPKSVSVPSPFTSPRRLVRFLRTLVGRVWEGLSRPGPFHELWMRGRFAVLRSVTRWNLLSLERECNLDEMFPGVSATWSDEERQHVREYFEAIWSHEFRGMPIDMVLFRVALDPFEGPHEEELGWRRVTTGRITVEYLTGSHNRMVTAGGSQDLASRLEPYLRCRVVSSSS